MITAAIDLVAHPRERRCRFGTAAPLFIVDSLNEGMRVLIALLDIVQVASTVRAKRPVRAETVCARPLLLWRRSYV